MDFFYSKERLRKFNALRIVYLAGFVGFFILTEIGRKVYRPYVYREHLNDFGIADTIGNSLGTLTQIFLYLGLFNCTTAQGIRIVAFVTVGYTVYEIAQPVLPRGTFDWKDVFATVAAGIAASAILLAGHFFPTKRTDDLLRGSKNGSSEEVRDRKSSMINRGERI